MHAQADAIPMDSAAVTVLIIEDEQISRRALASLLASYGFRTRAFASAEAALRDLDFNEQPEFALLDVDLPGMSGLDAIARLERLWPDIRPVLITASETDRLWNFRRSHDVDFFPKPVDFPRLLRLLLQSSPEV
jgi:DNA-binding NtrC family response regulator